jgi:hypothetical protein
MDELKLCINLLYYHRKSCCPVLRYLHSAEYADVHIPLVNYSSVLLSTEPGHY